MLADHQHSCSSIPRLFVRIAVRRAEKGELNQAIGRSRGGRTTKIHALTDGMCRPVGHLELPGFASRKDRDECRHGVERGADRGLG